METDDESEKKLMIKLKIQRKLKCKLIKANWKRLHK
jgi:hypothetical protein